MARLSSAGSYFCQPSNDLGQGSVAETELEVLQEPKIISQLLQENMLIIGRIRTNITSVMLADNMYVR